jgi:esterase/lipase superfamily enzyme
MPKLYFATNRSYDGTLPTDYGDRFHPLGPQFYRVGTAEVDKVSDDPDEGYVVRKVKTAPEKSSKAKDDDKAKLGSTSVFTELRGDKNEPTQDILVYIHGFANGFKDSLARGAQIVDAYASATVAPNAPPIMFVFSWPSDASTTPWGYASDRDDAAQSGIAMARALKRLIDFLEEQPTPCRRRMHIVSHSMGNWALRHAVLGIRSLLGAARLPKLFDNAFLMAADEDDDAFEQEMKLALLPELARSIHVYHSVNDGALVISDTTKFNPDRLGSAGPRTFSGISTRVTAVDCSKVDATKPLHVRHQYYRLRTEVIADVRAVIAGRLRPDEIPGRETIESGRRYRIKAPPL